MLKTVDRAKRRNDVEMQLTEITPEIAAAWLEKNTINRKPQKRFIDQFSRDMTTGNWKNLAHNGRCHVCGLRLTARDDYHIDHVIALENGGTDDDSNLAPCCEGCHSSKTSDDAEIAGHGRRMAAKHFVPKRFKQSKWRR